MSSATVRVRQTTTTTTTTASVLVINSGYLKSRLGIIKALITILSAIIFILLVYDYSNYYRYLFLLLVSYTHMHTVGLMLLTCLLSISTAGLLPKLTLDFVFHFVAFSLYLTAGIWTVVESRETSVKIASIETTISLSRVITDMLRVYFHLLFLSISVSECRYSLWLLLLSIWYTHFSPSKFVEQIKL